MYEALALAAAGGAVGAMTTEAWGWMRGRLTTLLGRGGGSGARVMVTLDEAERLVAQPERSDADLAEVTQHLARGIEDLLVENPRLERGLDDLVRDAVGRGFATLALQQYVSARDQAQQAGQGQGVQTNTFGRPDGD